MRRALSFSLLTIAVPFLLGCWGESAKSIMEKRARALGAANKEKEAKAAAAGGVASADNAGGMPKTNIPATPSAATPATTTNGIIGPPAVTAPSTAIGANATVEQRRARTMENLSKLGRALNGYADGYAGYPTTKMVGAAVNPPMSWRVAILPLLGYDKLFKEYRPSEPWDSAANKQLLAKIPPEFQSPDRRDTKTNYLVPLGIEAAFGNGRRMNAGMFEDSPDCTLILVEVDDAQAIEWTRPDDLVVQPGLGGSVRSKLGSLRGDGFFAVLATGRVCRIKPDADELALKALFTVSSGDTDLIKDAIQDATAVPIPPPAPAETVPPPGTIAGEKQPAVAPGTTAAPGTAAAAKPAAVKPGGVPYTPDDEPGLEGSKTAPLPALTKKKHPVPSETALVAARTALKELYRDDYKQATDTQKRRSLAKKLVASSSEVGEDHAAEYELLRIARDLSAQNGDLTEALKTLSLLEAGFEIDGPTMRLETLKLFQKSSDALAKNKELADEAKKLVTDAVAADAYDTALEALKIEKGATKRDGDTDRLAKSARLQTWLEAAQRAYQDVPKAEARLASGPSDPQANQTVGIYLCLVKGKWEQGLPQLAQSTDRTIRLLAKLDLSSSKSPPEIFDLANQYWELAEHKPDLEEQGLKLRAAYWYAQSVQQLPDGLDKIKARKRLAEVIEAYGKEEAEKATARNDIATAARVGTNDE